MIEGSVKEQYYMLWDYCEEVKKANSDSKIKMMCDLRFEGHIKLIRIYICLDTCKNDSPVVG